VTAKNSFRSIRLGFEVDFLSNSTSTPVWMGLHSSVAEMLFAVRLPCIASSLCVAYCNRRCRNQFV